MTENIRRLFKQMDRTTQDEALILLKNEFKLQSNAFIKNEWILSGSIPEEYQEQTVELFQNLLRKNRILRST